MATALGNAFSERLCDHWILALSGQACALVLVTDGTRRMRMETERIS
jgi:hypothetical protein